MQASSETIAGDGVADRQREEGKPDGQHEDVQHMDAPSKAPFSARRRWLLAMRSLEVHQKKRRTWASLTPDYLSLVV
jgi:hypothetical protein